MKEGCLNLNLDFGCEDIHGRLCVNVKIEGLFFDTVKCILTGQRLVKGNNFHKKAMEKRLDEEILKW